MPSVENRAAVNSSKQATFLSRYRRWVLATLALAFLAALLCYSEGIPAWEANDELDHVANIEYALVCPFSFMPIAWERWHETHQPPLYYWLMAGWQRLLGIESFTVSRPPNRAKRAVIGKLVLAHDKFDNVQREQARALHKLRLVSPFVGLITLVFTYCCARYFNQSEAFRLSATAIVALHPKFMIVSAVITNDSLAILLGSALLLLATSYVSAARSARARLLLATAFGLTAGVSVLTKLNLLPLVVLLGVAALLLAPYDWRTRLLDLAIIVVITLRVSGGWLLHNKRIYGEWFAEQATQAWLDPRLPRTIRPVSYFDAERFLDFVPKTLFRTFWYNGGWNQQIAPFGFYFVLWCLAAVCGFASVRSTLLLAQKERVAPKATYLLWTSLLGAAAAIYLIARQTTQAEGRIVFIAISAVAIILTHGSLAFFRDTLAERGALLLWPVVLGLLNLYVVIRFVVPFWGV